MKKISVKKGITDAIKADTISLVAFEVGLFGWMALVSFVILEELGMQIQLSLYIGL